MILNAHAKLPVRSGSLMRVYMAPLQACRKQRTSREARFFLLRPRDAVHSSPQLDESC
jgi:hypothetical protein